MMYQGTGIYTLPEAARLIRVPAQKMHRWLYGYTHARKARGETSRGHSEPLWTPQLSKEDFDSEVIGFRDLLEVRFVAAFVDHGVPLVVIRRCLETARELLDVHDYPMSTGAFKTDGKTIFAEAVERSRSERTLLDLKSRQFVFKDIISPSLWAGIQYDGNQAVKWFPDGPRSPIVLDPARQFGSPIIDASGVPTSVLYASYRAEGADTQAVSRTARVYDVPVKVVDAAVRFEENLKRAAH